MPPSDRTTAKALVVPPLFTLALAGASIALYRAHPIRLAGDFPDSGAAARFQS
jgi:hypothetical protein